jgi:MarR family
VASWTFLTTHARILLLVAHDPGVRLRDIAASLDITERSAFGAITDLVEAGYVVKEKDGRRNRYHIQAHLPLPEPTARERTVGEMLVLLTGTGPAVTAKPAAAADRPDPGSGQDRQRAAPEQVRGGRRPGEPPARPNAMTGRGGDSPPAECDTGREESGT